MQISNTDNYKLIFDSKKVNLQAWQEFVDEHPKSNAFHTSELFFAIDKSEKNKSIIIVVTDKQDSIVALLTAYIQYSFSIQPLKYLSSRIIIYGEPLIKDDNKKVLDLIWKAYEQKFLKKAVYSQIRNYYAQQDSVKELLKKYKFEFEEHLNILIDLTKTEEELWKDVYSKRRNEIRRATKENTEFRLAIENDELRLSYDILTEVYNRAKLPLPSYKYFLNIVEASNNKVKLLNFVATNQNQIIGCMFVLAYKNRLFDFYAGAKKAFYNKYPNDLIPWEVFKWGKQNGHEIFDFGGAGKPDVHYGVRDYKKKFGGEFVNYGRFEKVHNNFIMKVSTFGFKLLQKIKNGL